MANDGRLYSRSEQLYCFWFTRLRLGWGSAFALRADSAARPVNTLLGLNTLGLSVNLSPHFSYSRLGLERGFFTRSRAASAVALAVAIAVFIRALRVHGILPVRTSTDPLIPAVSTRPSPHLRCLSIF